MPQSVDFKMAVKKTVDAQTACADIMKRVDAGKVAPVYLLMGEETYYIDFLTRYLLNALLQPEERDFNLLTMFGADTDVSTVINAARGFPMGASRLVVCVYEAGRLAQIERLALYLKNPQPTTVLILAYKHGGLTGQSKLVSAVRQCGGEILDSPKLRDYQLPAFINRYARQHDVSIEEKAVEMLVESVGDDLSRMASEIDKLLLSLPSGDVRRITADAVAQGVGMSKEYNVFELQDALVKKDVYKANRIANYFYKNAKANPIQKTLPVLFRFFSNVLLAYYAPDKSERGVANWLGVSDWQVRNTYMPAMRAYTGVKVMQVIRSIREADRKSKGGEGSSAGNTDLLRELLYVILH